jgi:hypothetical protein
MAIRIASFAGEIPKLIPRLLNQNYAQIAQNTKLENGALVPIRRGKYMHRMPFDCKTIYLYNGEWLGWENFVNVEPAPVASDRLYVTGDGKPKIIVGGVTYDLAVARPTSKVTAVVSGTPDPALSSTVLFAYTWVTEFDEESEPSDLSDGVLWSPSLSITVSGFSAPPTGRAVNRMRIYRSQTSALGQTTLYFIAERAASTANFVYDQATYPMNEVIPSTDYNPPPDDLQGLVSLPNGFMAAFSGKKIYFCERYRPHAWPEKYVMTVDYPIVGLGVFGSAVAVLTQGMPYVMQGTSPDAMTSQRLEVNLPCVSANSIVDLGYSVAYASPQGLVTISQSGAVVASAALMTVDQWKEIQPDSFIAGQYAGRYMVSYNYTDATGIDRRGMVVFDLSGAQPFIVRVSDDADAMYFELGTGRLFLLRNSRDVYEWDAIGEPYGEQVWRSKKFVMQAFTNYGCIMVEGEDVMTSAQKAQEMTRNAEIRALNRQMLDNDETGGTINALALNMFPLAGSLLQPISENEQSFSVAVYADDQLITTVFHMNTPIPLPSGFTARTWEVEVRGNQMVTAIVLAYTPMDIAEG